MKRGDEGAEEGAEMEDGASQPASAFLGLASDIELAKAA